MKSLIPWRPGQKHAALTRRNNWFHGWWNDPFDSLLPAVAQPFSARMPTVDVSEDKKEVRVRAEIPGMTDKDIQLTWHDGVLRIRGEKRDEKEERKKDRCYRECSYGSFTRDIPLGKSVDWKNAAAKYRNGVLTVVLPKTEETSKVIEVKIS
ncbi:MAG: Hsp20/alpha crystallin family protein [Chitinispirillaceae bacterium]|jgi:HSP20 family protein|nr:Hsp20/alpha crystallin family protein [Chitinispirillaceae bacterium]